MRTVPRHLSILSIAAVVAAACDVDDPRPIEDEPAAPEPPGERDAGVWNDCDSQYPPLPSALEATVFLIQQIQVTKGVEWGSLCNANAACESVVAEILSTILTMVIDDLKAEKAELKEIRDSIVEWVANANAAQLGAPNVPQVVAAAFVAQLGFAAVAASPKAVNVFAIHQRAINKLAVAIGKAHPHIQIREAVANTLGPISAGLTTFMVPLGTYTTCAITEFANMVATAEQIVAVGPGPFGGFQPPQPPPGNGALAPGPDEHAASMRSDDATSLSAAPEPTNSDPYGPLFGPTNPWQGMPTVTADFSSPPLDSDLYAMKRCEAPGDACGPIHLEPICEAALDGGPDCQVWASYRQLWFTYSFPADVGTSMRVVSEVDDSCSTKPEGALCGGGMEVPGYCHGDECELVPAGLPLCVGGGIAPTPAEFALRYSCNASNASLCGPGQCVGATTKNASYQYNLGQYPANVTCDRLTPQGYSPSMLFAGDTIGCRVTIRTDGPPAEAGQQRSLQFRVIHADVEEAWGDDSAMRIEQQFEVVWNSEVPPSDCYTWNSYEKRWQYTYWSCGSGDYGDGDDGGDDGGFSTGFPSETGGGGDGSEDGDDGGGSDSGGASGPESTLGPIELPW